MTARGGKKRTKAKHTKTKSKRTKTQPARPVTMGVDIEQDDADMLAVLGDQRTLDVTWSPTHINRSVLVGTSIKHDSNASIKAKRPKYWSADQGVPNFVLFEHGSVDVASMPSYTRVHTDTNVKQCAYTALRVLGAQVQVLHTSCAFIYTKELEDAMQTAIHEAPLPMRLHRQKKNAPIHAKSTHTP